MRVFGWISAILSTLLVLAWPLVFFCSIFVFDNPSAKVPEAVLGVLLLGILSYPAGYAVAWGFILVRKWRHGPTWWTPPIPYLFLIPFIQLVLAVAAVMVLARLAR